MTRYVTIFSLIYFPGFSAVFLLHILFLHMITLQLALFRSLVWPLWIAFGWPHGVPLLMD